MFRHVRILITIEDATNNIISNKGDSNDSKAIIQILNIPIKLSREEIIITLRELGPIMNQKEYINLKSFESKKIVVKFSNSWFVQDCKNLLMKHINYMSGIMII